MRPPTDRSSTIPYLTAAVRFGRWSCFDVLLLNATGFDDALMEQCWRKLLERPPVHRRVVKRRRVLVLSQALRHAAAQLVGQRTFSVTWGACTVYLYEFAG